MHCPRCGVKLAENQVTCSNCGFLEDILGSKALPKDQVKPGEREICYSGFWRRAGAILLDIFILSGGEEILAATIGGLIWLMSFIGGHHVDFHIIESFAVGFGVVFAFGANWLYFTLLESSEAQATFGKRILGLAVSDVDHRRISFGQANIRYWGKILSVIFLLAGFWMMLFMKRKQTFHDLIAGTVVIKQF